jgi:hypothetical protein
VITSGSSPRARRYGVHPDDKLPKKGIDAMILTVNNVRIEGKIFVPREVRLIDDFNVSNKTFIAVTEARIYITEEAPPVECKLMLVNRNQVAFAVPIE